MTITPDTSFSIQEVIGGLGAILAAIYAFRKKLSDDSTDIARNKAEIDVIESLQNQRNTATVEADKHQIKITELREAIDRLKYENTELLRKMELKDNQITTLDSRQKILYALVTRLTTVIDNARLHIDDISNSRPSPPTLDDIL